MKNTGILLLLLALLFPVHCMEVELALTGTNAEQEQEQNDELKFSMFLAMVVGFNSQTCESFANYNIVNLTQGVSSGPHSGRICFIVSTSGPATIQVTTSGTAQAGIDIWSPFKETGVEIDDPTYNINQKYDNFKFQVDVLNVTTFTILVN